MEFMSTAKICRNCAEPFVETLKQKTFCSDACRSAYLSTLTEKQCRACKVTKPLSEFQSGKTIDGHANTCRVCIHERWKKWYEKNNTEKRSLNAARNQAFAAVDPAQYRFNRRLVRYRLTEEQYNELLAKFDGMCHACKQAPATDIDHDHLTQEVRGLLCSPCNLGIGNLGDSLDRVEAAYRYLFEHYEGA